MLRTPPPAWKLSSLRDFFKNSKTLEFSKALGIGAASFASIGSKDIAESPTASPERPKEKTTRQQVNKTTSCWGDGVMWFLQRNDFVKFRDDSWMLFCDVVMKLFA